MIPSGYNNHQLSLILAVETLKQTDWINRNQAEWVIENAKKYEDFLSEKQDNIIGTPERYDVVLETQGSNVIDTIRTVSVLLGRSNTNIKDLLKYLPCTVRTDMSFEEAIMIKNQLASVGAVSRIEKCNK